MHLASLATTCQWPEHYRYLTLTSTLLVYLSQPEHYWIILSRHNWRNPSCASVDPKDMHLASLANPMSMAGTPPVAIQLLLEHHQHTFQPEHYRTIPSRLDRRNPFHSLLIPKTSTQSHLFLISMAGRMPPTLDSHQNTPGILSTRNVTRSPVQLPNRQDIPPCLHQSQNDKHLEMLPTHITTRMPPVPKITRMPLVSYTRTNSSYRTIPNSQ